MLWVGGKDSWGFLAWMGVVMVYCTYGWKDRMYLGKVLDRFDIGPVGRHRWLGRHASASGLRGNVSRTVLVRRLRDVFAPWQILPGYPNLAVCHRSS